MDFAAALVVLLLCAQPSLPVRLTSEQRGQLWACKQLVCVVLILRMPWARSRACIVAVESRAGCESNLIMAHLRGESRPLT
jgi:hypothetical protein